MIEKQQKKGQKKTDLLKKREMKKIELPGKNVRKKKQ